MASARVPRPSYDAASIPLKAGTGLGDNVGYGGEDTEEAAPLVAAAAAAAGPAADAAAAGDAAPPAAAVLFAAIISSVAVRLRRASATASGHEG